MSLPFLPVAQPSIGSEELELVTDAIKSGWVSSIGKYIDLFEKDFAEFCRSKFSLALGNGTLALHLALLTLGIQEGDEVILPTLTFVATANVVKYCRAFPVFVDSNPQNWCLEPKALEAAITSRTRAIMPVHLFGHPCDMDPIMDLARKNRIWVVEDAAEAHGAEYRGKPVGSFGEFGAFSFYGNKIMTTGEGGALVTQSPELEKRARLLKDHAMSKKRRYLHEEIGYNFRMTNLQAALGVAQMRKFSRLLKEKQTYLKWYQEGLADLPDARLNPSESWAKPVMWLVCLDLREYPEALVEKLQEFLKENGIDTRPFFLPMHHLPPYKECRIFDGQGREGGAPVAEKLSSHAINLPSGYGLTKDDVDRVCQKIISFLKR